MINRIGFNIYERFDILAVTVSSAVFGLGACFVLDELIVGLYPMVLGMESNLFANLRPTFVLLRKTLEVNEKR